MLPTQTQIQHLARNARQRLIKVPVGIIGGYHGGNLGDMALGEAVKQELASMGINSGLETIYNLEQWPRTQHAILGGGAIGYADSLNKVINRYEGNYKQLAILGVDFNQPSYPDECLKLIRQAAYVSSRSKMQAQFLTSLTGRVDIDSHPDIAFSLDRNFCKEQREESITYHHRSKIMMVNLLPLYGKLENGKVLPVEKYKIERPELYENFEQMQRAYRSFVRQNVEQAIADGYLIETIPFTHGDAVYSKIVLEGLPVRHVPYYADPLRMIYRMAGADWVLATRFHATIFAMKLGKKLTPLAYAKKNERMLNELGIENGRFMACGDLALGNDEVMKPLKIDSAKIENWEQESADAIKNCIKALQLSV